MGQSYQSLGDYPRFRLASFPSPLRRAERLERSLREDGYASVPRIYLKHDDLLSLALGGNKIRNLEFLIGDALSRGATDVITAGRQQSNHCRLTAAACVKAGLRAHLILGGREPTRYTGNLLLDRMFGARVTFTGSDDRADRERAMTEAVRTIEREGGVAYTIPVGGSDPRGALGHVVSAEELLHQSQAAGIVGFTVVLATATGGTQAGLLAGFRRMGAEIPVRGFAVAKTADELAAYVRAIAEALTEELGIGRIEDELVVVDGRALGEGYGARTAEALGAIRRLAREEGVVADPTYTGKSFAGLFSLVDEGRFGADESVVFVHTGGGPALFA